VWTHRRDVNKSNSEVAMTRKEQKTLRAIALRRLAEPVIRSVIEKHLARWQLAHVHTRKAA
jgi:hypothetical protein